MKKIYIGLLFLTFSIIVKSQTVEIVKDFLPVEKGFGITPSDIVSNSEMMVFTGAVDGLDRGWLGITLFTEPFVTNGTADKFTALDINPNLNGDYKLSSNPKFYFVLKDTIYFVANDGTNDGLYKMLDVDGNYELVTTEWVPRYQPIVNSMDVAVFADTIQADSEDDNIYFLEWDGNEESIPSVATGHEGLYNMSGSAGFGTMTVAGATYYVFAAQNPNEDIGNELCVIYYNRRTGYAAQFTDLAPGDADENGYLDNGSPENFTVLGYEVYFNDIKGQVWKVDLAAGFDAVLVDDINSVINIGNTVTNVLGTFDGKLLFSGVSKTEAGTETDPRNVFTYNPGDGSVSPLNTSADYEIRDPESFVELDGKLYFSGNYRTIPYDNAASGNPLWCWDGTDLTTIASDLKGVRELHIFNNKVYFSATDPDGVDNGDETFDSTYAELFVYDPSTATGISKVNTSEMVVAPNPSNGFVTISGINTQEAAYILYDMSGKQVEKGLVVANQIDFKVGAGVYLLKVENKDQVQVVKIIIR